MEKYTVLVVAAFFLVCCLEQAEEIPLSEKIKDPVEKVKTHTHPKIASWLSKKDELLAAGHPYDLIMTGWITPQEADRFQAMNPDIMLLAGLTVNWVYDDDQWKTFFETLASADGTSRHITEDMFLKRPDGERCAFGWASPQWGHQEIYAVDVRTTRWKEFVLSAYRTVLEQPQHDGVIVDMVLDTSWCPDALSNEEWVSATKNILREIKKMADNKNKLVIYNAGKEFSDIDAYAEYMDGYVMENFLGSWGADYDTGLKAADSSYIIIYAVDTDDTGNKSYERMRLGLTLSLLHDTTYFAYDFGPRDHGQAWWFPEYEVDLGAPLGTYYKKDNAYWREFEKGIVISSPYQDVTVTFSRLYTDITRGNTSSTFVVRKGDGRIFVRSEKSSGFLGLRRILNMLV